MLRDVQDLIHVRKLDVLHLIHFLQISVMEEQLLQDDSIAKHVLHCRHVEWIYAQIWKSQLMTGVAEVLSYLEEKMLRGVQDLIHVRKLDVLHLSHFLQISVMDEQLPQDDSIAKHVLHYQHVK